MKIILALAASILCAQADLNIRCGETDNRLEVIRSDFMNMFKIANMQEMKYDPKLAEIGQNFTYCDSISNSVNYRISLLTDDDDRAIIEKIIGNSSDPHYLEYVEWLHPLQTSYAKCEVMLGSGYCDLKTAGGNIEEVPIYDGISFYIIGPVATIAESDFEFGEPGTKCSHGRTEQNFCKAMGLKNSTEQDGQDFKERKRMRKMVEAKDYVISWLFVVLLAIWN